MLLAGSTMKVATTLMACASSSDLAFQSWCSSVGIEAPMVQLLTTTKSVAGRGVFALNVLQEGDVAISIPEYTTLNSYHASREFPKVATKLKQYQENYKKQYQEKSWFGKRWWQRLRRNDVQEKDDDVISWKAELTAYALEATRVEDHPWREWIAQWQRNDPVHALFESGTTLGDTKAISEAVHQLQEIMPDLPKHKLQAALFLRLEQWEHDKQYFEQAEDEAQHDNAMKMYSLLGSRAMELGEGISGVLPMFDMINHSLEPNVALSFNGEAFELFCLRDIQPGEELFLCYTDLEQAWDEDAAVWTLVQWGIPTPRNVWAGEAANQVRDAVVMEEEDSLATPQATVS